MRSRDVDVRRGNVAGLGRCAGRAARTVSGFQPYNGLLHGIARRFHECPWAVSPDQLDRVVLDLDNVENSKVKVDIEAASFDTNHFYRDNDTRSEAFLEARKFWTIILSEFAIEAFIPWFSDNVEIVIQLAATG